MSSPASSPSLIVRFLDSFLQERNIKWVLAVGMLVLLGSSLLLVTTHWDDCTPLWQNLIMLGYAAAVHGAGQWTYHRLGLRRTGAVLQGLTILLVPILFLVVRWVPERPPGESVGSYLMLGLTGAFAFLAARRIFAFSLRLTQPTFLACYLILSMAGAILPAIDSQGSVLVVAALWSAFAIGAIKVSRHVFWLTEERRAPRVVGFLPILLLGGQFLFLYAVHPSLHVDREWIGLGCVLVAIPILATGDAVADVFRRRTGDLVRPLPWAIVTPVVIGLILCAAGAVLAGIGLSPPMRPKAFVVTTAVVSALMAVTARRTGKSAFVWAMLFTMTLAYNFSPGFFLDVVRTVLDRGASMVREQRLPFAFYGLTYVPLLLGLVIVSHRASRQGSELFARPLRQFAMILTCLLWGLSLTHEKALFPVGLSLVAIAVLQAWVLRCWSAATPALLAWITAAIGLPVFADQVLGFTALAHRQIECLTAATGLLFVVSRWCDSYLEKSIPLDVGRLARRPCRTICIAVAVTIALGSLVAADGTTRLAGWAALAILAAANQTVSFRYLLLILVNWHVVFSIVAAIVPGGDGFVMTIEPTSYLSLVLPLAAIAAASVAMWELVPNRGHEIVSTIASCHRAIMGVIVVVGLAESLNFYDLTYVQIGLACVAFGFIMAAEWIAACRDQRELRVWTGLAVAILATAYLIHFGVVPLHRGYGMFVILAVGFGLGILQNMIGTIPPFTIFARTMRMTSLVMPLVAVAAGVARHGLGEQVEWLGMNSLALLLAAAFYFWRGLDEHRRAFHVLAAIVLNIALILLWRDLTWTDPQFFLVPIGVSILILVELLKSEIPESLHNLLRYAGALVILVSPTFHIVGGSWIHLLTLMIASVSISLIAIGLRVRALLYTGAAFLVADLAAMLVRGSIDNSNVLWIAGFVIGAGIIALGAYCEKHRELLLARMELLSTALKTWE